MVTDELLLLGSCSGTFHALDRETGEEVWSYDTRQDSDGMEFHGDPVVFGDRVVTCSDRGDPSCTYAFGLSDGALLWKNCEDNIESDVFKIGDAVIDRAWNGDLMALGCDDGALRWRLAPENYRFRMYLDQSPVARDGLVYFGAVDGKVYAVDGESGEVLWKREIGARITGVDVDERWVIAGSSDRRLHRISRLDGELDYRVDLEGRSFGRPTLAKGILVTLLGNEMLAAYDGAGGDLLWLQSTESTWSSYQPLVWRDLVIVGDSAGEIFGYRLDDGVLAWTAQVEGRVRGLGAMEDVLYVGTLQGNVYAVAWE